MLEARAARSRWRHQRRALGPGVLCLCAALAACGDDGVAPGAAPLRVEVVGGDGQKGLPGERLVYPVVFRIVDGGGRPVAGVPVRFDIASGGGTAEPGSAASDGQGRVTARWRLGSGSVRIQRLSASLIRSAPSGGSSPVVSVQATAVGPEEADRVFVGGALGPLKGIMLFAEDARIFDLILEKAAADTVILLPPMGIGEVNLLVFSHGNRPLLQRVHLSSGLDTVRATLKPPVAVDVRVNVYAGAFGERKKVIEGQLAKTEEVWVRNAMGLRLGTVTWTDVTGGGDRNVSSAGLCGNVTPGSVIEASFVTTVDLYYAAGYGCPSGHVFMGLLSDRYPYLLAHEMGHTFGLTHTSWGLMNPMSPGGDVHVGETFRAHFDSRSALNTIFGAQPEAQRRICLGRTDSLCPPNDFDFSEPVAASPASLQQPAAGAR